jgi:hypothetical protein
VTAQECRGARYERAADVAHNAQPCTGGSKRHGRDECTHARAAAALPKHPELLVTRTIIGDGYVILLRGGHRLVDRRCSPRRSTA